MALNLNGVIFKLRVWSCARQLIYLTEWDSVLLLKLNIKIFAMTNCKWCDKPLADDRRKFCNRDHYDYHHAYLQCHGASRPTREARKWVVAQFSELEAQEALANTEHGRQTIRRARAEELAEEMGVELP